MVTLEQFGYKSINPPSSLPLVVVLANCANRPALQFSPSQYQELFFGPGKSVARYFSAISNGRFTFVPAGDGVYSVNLSPAEMDLDLPQRFGVIKLRLFESAFDMTAWDRDNDSTVGDSELCLLTIDSDSDASATTRNAEPGTFAINGREVAWRGRGIAAGHRSSLMTLCHELLHMLGVQADMYGSTQSLNEYYTTMGRTPGNDDRRTWHLDPFHKMKLGWCEPRLYDATTVGSVSVKVYRSDNADAPVLLYDGAGRSPKRFFMLEYRTAKVPFDEDVGSNGIGVWGVALDNNLNPYTIRGSNVDHPDWQDFSVNLQGPHQEPPFWNRGGGPLWRAGKTPILPEPLDGFDNWPPRRYLNVHPFNDSDGQVQVDISSLLIAPVANRVDQHP